MAKRGHGGANLWDRVAYRLGADALPYVEALRAIDEIAALESEIERAFAVYMLLDFQRGNVPVDLRVPADPKASSYFLLPQYVVGSYRVDFVFGLSVKHHPRNCVAIELDGHEWHEKTKAQAARDKSRDRFLSQHFGKVVHFTGSEIFDDVQACGAEMFRVFEALMDGAPK